jgi:S-adenosyl-L-methionine hydrolase (adenosine-forming)
MNHQSTTPNSRPVIALLTDFGQGDGDVGVMKGVIASIAPDAQTIDITHEVAPQNIPSGAWILSTAYRYFPQGTVFVCVVDPGVGSSRNAIAVRAGDKFFVGPDNGLFSYVLAQQTFHNAVVLSNPAYHLPQVSSTFHGRDIFAPVGAHLANGVELSVLGTAIDSTKLQRIDTEPPLRQGGYIEAHIIHIDRFGNLITDIPLTLVPELSSSPIDRGNQHVDSQPGINFPTLGTVINRHYRFFAESADDGQPFIYADSSGYVGIAVRNGNAAMTFGAEMGIPITYKS